MAIVSGSDRPRRLRRLGVSDSGRPTEFLDRAQADTIGLAEGAVDGARLRNAHLGAVNKGRHVSRIGVAVAYEAVGFARFVDCRFEDPAAKTRVGESFLKKGMDSKASAFEGYLKEPGVGHVPLAIDEENFPLREGET